MPHIYGLFKVFNDAGRFKEVIDWLTRKYESGFETLWQPNYNATILGAIVGVEVLIKELLCKYNLCQNLSIKDQELVIKRLKDTGSNSLAEAKEKINAS